jgi:hypothetical protein
LKSINAARVRGAGLAVLAPGALAVTAAASQSASADTHRTAGQDAPQPIRATFKRHHVLSGGLVPVEGMLLTHEGGRKVLLQVRSHGSWHTVGRARTAEGGAFRTAYRPHGLGTYQLRTRLVGTVAASAGANTQVSATRSRGRVNVYRTSLASWYGPGFYGGRTACGRTLGAGTLGVANKTLPCGARVTLHYRGRTVTVPVIDRGPYVAGRDWDLTPATKAKLRFPSTGSLWSTR